MIITKEIESLAREVFIHSENTNAEGAWAAARAFYLERDHLAARADAPSPDLLLRPITELHLSVRIRRTCDLLKILTIGDLTTKSETELMSCPNFGLTSLSEVRNKLEELGLSLRPPRYA